MQVLTKCIHIFQEKRDDREVENLFSILEKVTEVKDTQIDKIVRAGDILPKLNEKLTEALVLFEDIENNSKERQQVC